jgi:hypothetical protein
MVASKMAIPLQLCANPGEQLREERLSKTGPQLEGGKEEHAREQVCK